MLHVLHQECHLVGYYTDASVFVVIVVALATLKIVSHSPSNHFLPEPVELSMFDEHSAPEEVLAPKEFPASVDALASGEVPVAAAPESSSAVQDISGSLSFHSIRSPDDAT